MQTLGFLVDQLGVVNLKMWWAQEGLYRIRKMSFEEFQEEFKSVEKQKEIFEIFKKACDLNVQRSQIVDEIDEYIVKLVTDIQSGNIQLDTLTQKKHKTY